MNPQAPWNKNINGWNIRPDKISFQSVEVIGNIYENPELIKN